LDLIAGVDEAGRGPLAGPVVAAVVVLQVGQAVTGVRDSKKLSAAQREELVAQIHAAAIDWSIGMASVEEIDRLNILGGTMLAMRRAVEGLKVVPGLVRVDGNRRPDLPAGLAAVTETLVGGDDICPAIGAASILAKVERDRIMADLHHQFPGYGFDRHKGYPTVAHREALAELGASPVHRMSFRPVRELLETASQTADK
jgi:ribonuclease HII